MADNHKFMEEEAPDEIFNNEGQLVASKLETPPLHPLQFRGD